VAEIPNVLGAANASVRWQRMEVPWIWEGVIALGAITLLSAPEKTGKTTLLSLLLDRRRAGGHLLGRTVWPGKTFVCTEEDDRLWALRQPPLDFGPHVTFRRPRGPVPRAADWQRFIDDLIDKCLEDEAIGAYDLLVIDTAVRFLPLAQRNKGPLQEALAHMGKLAGVPLGVLIINQSRTVHARWRPSRTWCWKSPSRAAAPVAAAPAGAERRGAAPSPAWAVTPTRCNGPRPS
jgi:hypothetical protein